jgi:3alpha(or 20beta)-hydroxysteroid dehydrogenase
VARLEGKVALITGAAVGMGASHARMFVDEGASVILSDINVADGAKLADSLGPNAIFLRHDVTDPSSWRSVVKEAATAFGAVTVLVNNAGLAGPAAKTADLSDEDYFRTVNVDQSGIFFGMRAVIPGMIEAGGGSIVNISSVAGFAHMAGSPSVAYTGAKFAVRGMTKAAAVEYGEHHIRVNSIHPGGILTPMMLAAIDDAAMSQLAAAVPAGRLGDPREISYAVVFLASDEASYISGTELIVDGGLQAG